jgi:hypothetical protein
MKDYHAQQVRRFEIAHLSTRTNYSHHDYHDNDHDQKQDLQQHHQQQHNSSRSKSNSDDSDSHADLHFIMEQFLAYCSVENTLLVIGVSEAIDTIPPSLLQDFGLRKHFSIELLSPNHASYLLKQVLSLSGLSIASPLSSSSAPSSSSSSVSSSVSTEEEDAIRDGLLGLRIYDVATLARRIRQSKVKEYLHNNYHRGIAKDNDANNGVDGVVDDDVDNQQHLQSSSNDRRINKSRIAMDYVLASDILTAINRLQPIGITKVNKSNNNNSNSSCSNHQMSLDDIGGYKDVIRSIMNIVRNPILYERIYEKCPVKLPRALLLYGYPGCGKTYIAQVSDVDYSVLCIINIYYHNFYHYY